MKQVTKNMSIETFAPSQAKCGHWKSKIVVTLTDGSKQAYLTGCKDTEDEAEVERRKASHELMEEFAKKFTEHGGQVSVTEMEIHEGGVH